MRVNRFRRPSNYSKRQTNLLTEVMTTLIDCLCLVRPVDSVCLDIRFRSPPRVSFLLAEHNCVCAQIFCFSLLLAVKMEGKNRLRNDVFLSPDLMYGYETFDPVMLREIYLNISSHGSFILVLFAFHQRSSRRWNQPT